MKHMQKEILNALIECYPQFADKSLLYDDIQKVVDCTSEQAKEYAATHCNMVSFWAILKARGSYNPGYADFFKWMLENKYCTVKGFISPEKFDILKAMGINDCTGEYFKKYEDLVNPMRLNPLKFYQMKIKANTQGDHFMTCYVDKGVVKLSDTSSRGIDVEAIEFVTNKNFKWIREY